MEEANLSFENQWNSAFEGAEMSPSEHVWTSIDGVLANQQASGFKKRILFFKWVAAASVSIAVLAISALWIQNTNEAQLTEFEIPNEGTTSLAANEQTKNSLATNETITTSENSESINNNDLNNQIGEGTTSDNGAINHSNNNSSNSVIVVNNDENLYPTNQALPSIIDSMEEQTPAESYLTAINPLQSNFELLTKLNKPDQLYKVADPYALKNLVIQKDEFSLWAGVSMSAGTFNPNNSSSSENEVFSSASLDALNGEDAVQDFAELSNVLSNEETLNSGSSVSAGIDIRGKVSNKFILTSGIHYLKNSSSLGSNLVVSDASNGDSFAIRNSDAGSSTLLNGLSDGSLSVENSPSNFSNGIEYLSIPLKAGFVVLDRKINIVLNSGFSTSFLINANLNSSDGDTQLFSEDDSFSNSFKPVLVNFLSSVELGYTFKEKYLFSIEPNYSQSLTDFTKSGSSFSGKSSNFGVSVGIKYNF